MRDHVIVKNERRALVAYSKNTRPQASPEFLRFLRGAAAALDWATGSVDTAPVGYTAIGSRPAGTVDADAIAAEIRLCDQLLAGGAAKSDPHYLNGVEHALRWMLELESEPPVPFDAAAVAPAA